jgi:hypothetical protein
MICGPDGHGSSCTQSDTLRRIDVAVARIEERVASLPDGIALAISRHTEQCISDRSAATSRRSVGPESSIRIPRASWTRLWAAIAAAATTLAAWAGIKLLG